MILGYYKQDELLTRGKLGAPELPGARVGISVDRDSRTWRSGADVDVRPTIMPRAPVGQTSRFAVDVHVGLLY